MKNDIMFMNKAIEQARLAREKGEVPIGAVVVMDGKIISVAHNLRESNRMATAHAEILAIEEACKCLGGWRLDKCTLYVTLEPCPMCSGAIVNSRINKVVYGASDPLAGCCGSVIDLNFYPFNHSFEIVGGVMADECRALLTDFFEQKRKHNEL